MNKVKEFSTSNEILVLTKDKRDGSKEDDSFKVATSDDASIAVSFQIPLQRISTGTVLGKLSEMGSMVLLKALTGI